MSGGHLQTYPSCLMQPYGLLRLAWPLYCLYGTPVMDQTETLSVVYSRSDTVSSLALSA